MIAALSTTADEKLTSFALRLVLSDRVGIPAPDEPDLLTEAERVFAPAEEKPARKKTAAKPALVKKHEKKPTTQRAAA